RHAVSSTPDEEIDQIEFDLRRSVPATPWLPGAPQGHRGRSAPGRDPMKEPAGQGTPVGRRAEAAALLAAAPAAMEQRACAEAARAVLRACRAILGAEAGFVAVCTAGGESIDVILHDPDGPAVGAGAVLPVPLRRLGVRAARTGRTHSVESRSKRTTTPWS